MEGIGSFARVVVHGLLSQPWAETPVRQGNVRDPRLFTIWLLLVLKALHCSGSETPKTIDITHPEIPT